MTREDLRPVALPDTPLSEFPGPDHRARLQRSSRMLKMLAGITVATSVVWVVGWLSFQAVTGTISAVDLVAAVVPGFGTPTVLLVLARNQRRDADDRTSVHETYVVLSDGRDTRRLDLHSPQVRVEPPTTVEEGHVDATLQAPYHGRRGTGRLQLSEGEPPRWRPASDLSALADVLDRSPHPAGRAAATQLRAAAEGDAPS